MKFVVLASLLASAAAFAPARNAAPRVAPLAAFDIKSQIGAQMPLGYFDPIGLMKDADEETFTFYRNVELKHGRIAMMAVLGTYISFYIPSHKFFSYMVTFFRTHRDC